MQRSLLTAHELAQLPQAPAIDFSEFARGTAQELSAFLGKLDADIPIEGTLAKGHAYFILHDGNGRPRIDAFAQELANFALEYAIPRQKISEAKAVFDKTGSPYLLNALQRDAQNLFTELEKSGEGGELLLFWFAERVLNIPQIITKMALKTSSNMHVHGSDGVHADSDPTTGQLRLYWCESKIYSSVEKAITAALAGLYKFLASPFSFGGEQDNDIRLINYIGDIGNAAITKSLKQFLDPKHQFYNSVKNCAICLVGGSSSSYNVVDLHPRQLIAQVSASLEQELPGWLSHSASRIGKLKISEFIIHIIYVPLPDADDFRLKFKSSMIGDR